MILPTKKPRCLGIIPVPVPLQDGFSSTTPSTEVAKDRFLVLRNRNAQFLLPYRPRESQRRNSSSVWYRAYFPEQRPLLASPGCEPGTGTTRPVKSSEVTQKGTANHGEMKQCALHIVTWNGPWPFALDAKEQSRRSRLLKYTLRVHH